MDKPVTEKPSQAAASAPEPVAEFERFSLPERIQHLLFLASFTLLGITGLAQRYAEYPAGLAVLSAFGGIQNARVVHHASAFVMMWVAIFHVLGVGYRVYVMRRPLSMLPLIDDFKHLFTDIQYYLGLRKHRAYYGRYNYAEKVEYAAVVWGTLIMGLTGFMMWNPITTTKLLPGSVIPAAKTAHSAEAVLAVLAIIIWHVYFVHIKFFNKSMFTGKLTRAEMQHEHPAELAMIESGKGWQRPPQAVIRKRQQVYFPVAAILGIIMGAGAIWFVRVEPQTAITTTLPQAETAEVFVPVTPTPRPTLAPTPTPELAAGVSGNSWEGKYSALFANRCGSCHVKTAVSGLSLATYESALKGGNSGPGIVPGNPDASKIVQIQSAGNHPGQLTITELNDLIAWILAGAPEK
jgi:cytochrome b subunit of formate dehydrogenase